MAAFVLPRFDLISWLCKDNRIINSSSGSLKRRNWVVCLALNHSSCFTCSPQSCFCSIFPETLCRVAVAICVRCLCTRSFGLLLMQIEYFDCIKLRISITVHVFERMHLPLLLSYFAWRGLCSVRRMEIDLLFVALFYSVCSLASHFWDLSGDDALGLPTSRPRFRLIHTSCFLVLWFFFGYGLELRSRLGVTWAIKCIETSSHMIEWSHGSWIGCLTRIWVVNVHLKQALAIVCTICHICLRRWFVRRALSPGILPFHLFFRLRNCVIWLENEVLNEFRIEICAVFELLSSSSSFKFLTLFQGS